MPSPGMKKIRKDLVDAILFSGFGDDVRGLNRLLVESEVNEEIKLAKLVSASSTLHKNKIKKHKQANNQ